MNICKDCGVSLMDEDLADVEFPECSHCGGSEVYFELED